MRCFVSHRIPTGRNGRWRKKRQGTAGDRGFRSGSAPGLVEEASTLRKELAIKQGIATGTTHYTFAQFAIYGRHNANDVLTST